MTDSKYQWIGRKVRHAHRPIGPTINYDNESMRFVRNKTVDGYYISDHVQDTMPCKGGCGFHICSRRGPCAPKPADVLRDGWELIENTEYKTRYLHDSGATVWKSYKSCPTPGWAWAPPGKGTCHHDDCKPTRELARAAALAAAKPLDVLPEGWSRAEGFPQKDTFRHITGCHVWPAIDGWCWSGPGDNCARDTFWGDGARERAMAAALEAARPKTERNLSESEACAECGSFGQAVVRTGDDQWHCRNGRTCSARQAAKPAEPELRPGWEKSTNRKAYRNQSIYTDVFWYTISGSWMYASHWASESGFDTAEDAMKRAESLAGRVRVKLDTGRTVTVTRFRVAREVCK